VVNCIGGFDIGLDLFGRLFRAFYLVMQRSDFDGGQVRT